MAPPQTSDGPCIRRIRTLLALAALSVAVWVVYLPPTILAGGHTLAGMDYWQLHLPRLRYARDALHNWPPHLPAWFTRELLGTPFWSNIDNFPWIPTRLILLLFDPTIAYVVGVNLAALLSAYFTYAFSRRVGLGRLGAVVAGWTFAVSGFFASRVLAGQLTLLEAYPALPLLLWRATVSLAAVRRDGTSAVGSLFILGVATTCVVFAGHPQLPLYAVATTLLYVVWQRPDRDGLQVCLAILLGAGCSLCVWWPTAELIGRSTRLLPLGEANNIPLPYGRLSTFVFPWKDGWPPMVNRLPMLRFTGYPGDAYFWDTVCYVGLLPLLVLPYVLVETLWRRRVTNKAWNFVATIGLLALLTALPLSQQLLAGVRATVLRSPARQLYLTTFAFALTLGFAIDILSARPLLKSRWWRWGLVGLLCALHGWDLAGHARPFIRVSQRQLPVLPTLTNFLGRSLGDGRVAVDVGLLLALNRTFDDVGFYDSIVLARPYRAILDVAGFPLDFNTELLDGSMMSARTLSFIGARFVITQTARNDLQSLGGTGGTHVYSVANPTPRVTFFPPEAVRFLSEDGMHAVLRTPASDIRDLMLPLDAQATAAALTGSARADSTDSIARLAYARPNTDEIEITADTPRSGFVRLLETWDPGWSATIDDRPVQIFPGDGFLVAVAVDAGHHVVRLRFATPGVATGAVFSIASFAALVWLSLSSSRTRRERP